ncbi:PDC sensor domain-containing protein [Alsobacter sp. KACC 23698]|uniref:PDC sensor domain-containing protein n=1 Tax=Alsobacter sp. KACC 23698 TaxID=3149229 RepID=A0AAU7JJX2_9HYPH
MLKVASVLVPLAFFAFGAGQSYHQRLREAAQSVERTVDILDQQARRVFEVQDLILQQTDDRVAAMTWDEIGSSETLHQWLKAMDDRVAQIDVVWLIDPQGHGRIPAASSPLPQPPGWRTAIISGRCSPEPPVLSSASLDRAAPLSVTCS